MFHKLSLKSLLPFLLLPVLLLTQACDEEETDLGVDLQDPATLYNGIVDTAFGTAVTVFDDSLITSGMSNTLLGCYSDPLFGNAEASYFTQITTYDANGVKFDENYTIDSVELSLYIASLFYNDNASKSYKNLHFEVYQLAESLEKDTTYYSDYEMPVSNVCFFDDVVRIEESDSMVLKLMLNDAFKSLLENHVYETAEDFHAAMKGVRIRLVNDGVPVMATLNINASATNIRVYYKYNSEEQGEAMARTFDLSVGQSAVHFTHFKNNYNGVLSVFNTNHADSIAGDRYLYLSPMGGTDIKLNFDPFVRQFKQQHPFAIIHHAELILPVADIAPSEKPSLLAAMKYYNNGNALPIPDLSDLVTYSGYDGAYNSATNCSRIRVTQHLQKLVSSGKDYGTLIEISAPRSTAEHTVLNGYNPALTGNNPFRIIFVYSE